MQQWCETNRRSWGAKWQKTRMMCLCWCVFFEVVANEVSPATHGSRNGCIITSQHVYVVNKLGAPMRSWQRGQKEEIDLDVVERVRTRVDAHFFSFCLVYVVQSEGICDERLSVEDSFFPSSSRSQSELHPTAKPRWLRQLLIEGRLECFQL